MKPNESISVHIEERTPKGFILKIIEKKMSFLVFDHKGATIYADDAGLKILHRIPVIAFIGSSFSVRNRRVSEFTFCKVSKGKIVIPFYISGDKDLRYLLLETEEKIDLIPIKIVYVAAISTIAREAESGMRPDVIIVDAASSEADLVVIKNRIPTARVIVADQAVRAGIISQKDLVLSEPRNERASESDTINLNLLSKNPVFLARVHLRNLDLVKVNQLLLDFDMVADDAGFILSFIQTLYNRVSENASLKAHEQKLLDLRDDFAFYVALLENNGSEIEKIIDSLQDLRRISSFMTLIAKAKSMSISEHDAMTMIEYENRLLEKKENLQG